jgi:broad-specificity NMP kinase
MGSPRRTLVMMAGLPGAGKTTIAYALSGELGWQVIDKDRYRAELLKQEQTEYYASKAAYERSFDEIHRLLIEQRQSAIFDTAALFPFIIERVNGIIDCVEDVQLKVILCVVDRYLRNDRLENRPYQPTNIYVDPETISEYLRYFDHLPDDKLVLFTADPVEVSVAQAKKYVIEV